MKRIVMLLIAASLPALAAATDRSHTAVVKQLYPTANGTFAVIFDSDSTYCTNGGTPRKYYYATVGQNGLTADGHKLLYSTLLTALTTGYSVSIVFDDSTVNCYINRLVISVP